MRIKKLQHKRLNFPPQEIQSLREQLESVPLDKIAGVLEPFREWPFVRGDMYHWITVLNRFDDILAEVCDKFGLSSLQQADFDQDTQKMLVAILDFSRLLMENCINRNLYSSVERLDCLLNTSDPNVLESTLRILLRAAQRWSYQRDLKASLNTMSGRLQTITDPWCSRQAGNGKSGETVESMVSHMNEFKTFAREDTDESLKKSLSIVRYSYFRTADEVRQLEEDGDRATTSAPSASSSSAAAGPTASTSAEPNTSAAPTAGHRRAHSKRGTSVPREGLVSIDVPYDSVELQKTAPISTRLSQALEMLATQHRVPTAHHFKLRHRILVAMAFATDDSDLRFILLRSRIYAATILSQLMNEAEFKNNFLSREPNFTADIIGVLQPEVHAPLSVQTAVLLALESLLKQRSEVSGAYVALNASANHGVLMFILRKAFSGINDAPVYPYEFMNALYSFLTVMGTPTNGGQLLVSAGAVPIFVSAFSHTHPAQMRSIGRVAKLLDCLITSTNSAFPAFCSANGIAALVARMRIEVSRAVAVSDANPEAAQDLSSPVNNTRTGDITQQLYRRREILPAEHIFILKEMFKLLSHMLQQTAYHDRLRNLIETDLPKTLCDVFTHPAAFGGNIYGLAISITAMIVHNEPSSLPVIQEARLPEVLLGSLENHIPFNGDAIVNISGVLGAFCLNDVGMEQFRKSKVIQKVLGTFSDPDFVRVLQEGDVPGSFGASLDEFMRHFPTIKEEMMDHIIAMLQSVVDMGARDSSITRLGPSNTFLLRSAEENDTKSHLDDYYGMMLESATTFLEGLLEQRTHSTLFLEKGGWDLIIKAMRSPLLSFDFVKSRAFKSLHGLSSTLLETSQEKVYKALFAELREFMTIPLVVTSQSVAADANASEQEWDTDATAILALSDPRQLSAEEYELVHEKLHNTVSTAGVVALLANITGGTNGGSLSRNIKDMSEVMAPDDFIELVRSLCRLFCESITKAVTIEHALSQMPEPSINDDKTATPKDTSAPSSSPKGKEPEDSASAQAQAMDVDLASSPSSALPFVRTNMASLSEVVIALTVQLGDLIESLSNSLGLVAKAPKDGEPQTKLGDMLANVLYVFILDLLNLCVRTPQSITSAKLTDQAMVVIMKTMVYARHRLYLKLRIFTPFVEHNGLALMCQHLEAMWNWAATLPPAAEPLSEAEKSLSANKATTDPAEKLRLVLNNGLESILCVLSFILDGEPILECPEYPALCQEHEVQTRWFRASDLVTRIRLQAIPVMQHIWNSQLLFNGMPGLMQAFIPCLGPIINAKYETRAAPSRMSVRAHFPRLLDGRRLTQQQASVAARASGSQTPVPLLARAAGGAMERSSPLAQTPIQPLSAEEANPASSAAGDAGDAGDAPAPEQDMATSSPRRDGESGAATRHVTGSLRPTETEESHAVEAQSGLPGDGSSADQGAEAEAGRPMSVDSVDPAESAELAAATATATTSNLADAGSAEGNPDTGAEPEESSSKPVGVAPFNQPEWREAREAEYDAKHEQLRDLRAKLRDSITPRAIAVIDEFKEKAVMQVKGALELALHKIEMLSVVHMLANAFKPLLESVSAGKGADANLDERLAAHAHLWAVLLSNSSLRNEMCPYIRPINPQLLCALGSVRQRENTSPVWLAPLLLVIEQLLERDMRPQRVKIEPKDELHRIARRGLTKLPPSNEPLDSSLSPAAAASASNEADAVRRLFARPLFQNMPQYDPTFGNLLFGADEDEDNGEDRDEEDDDDEDRGDELSHEERSYDAGEHGAESAHAGDGDNTGADQSRQEGESSSAAQACASSEGLIRPVFSKDELVELQRLVSDFFADPVPHYSAQELNALLRLILILTRDSEFAVRFLDSGALANAVRVIRVLKVEDMASTVSTLKDRTPLGLVNALTSVWKEKKQELRQVRSLVMHVLRHIVESRPVLRVVMENMIRSWFEVSQNSSPDVNNYVRGTLAYALRDPSMYTDVTSERCFMPRYNDEMRVSIMSLAWRQCALLDEEEVDKFEATADNEEEFIKYLKEKKERPAFKPYEIDAESERLACRVVEFLAEEILSLRPLPGAGGSSAQLQNLAATATKARGALSTSGSGVTSVEDSPDTVAYRVFLMQCLSEMIASFPFTLQALFMVRSSSTSQIAPTPRKDKGKGKAVAAGTSGASASAGALGQEEGGLAGGQMVQPHKVDIRVRSPLISHLVHDLIVREAITHAQARRLKSKPIDAKGTELEQVLSITKHQIQYRQGQMSQFITFWAAALLSTICVRHQQGWTTTKSREGAPSVEQLQVLTLDNLVGSYDVSVFAARHQVLDHIVRAFRQCLSASASGMGVGGVDVIYARLASLAQLVYKLVIARPITHGRGNDSQNSEANSRDRESSSALRRIILERGMLDLLTAASSRVNLNHPESREMLSVFLRPIDLLSKVAVKISRDAVLTAWEESGQEKMPLVAMGQQQQRGHGAVDIWADEAAAENATDDDVPPDLYENSALGLHQNQRTAAGHSGGDEYDEGELMEEDFEEDIYDDDNSSASDMDTEDEMAEEMLLAAQEDDDGSHDSGSEIAPGEIEIEMDLDEVDDDADVNSDDSRSGSDSEDDGLGHHTRREIRLALADASDLIQAEEDRMMEEDEEAADFYGSDLEGEIVSSDEEEGNGADGIDAWESEISDAGEAILNALEQHGRQRGGRTGRGAAGEGGAGDAAAAHSDDVRNVPNDGVDADDDAEEDDDDDDADGSSNDGSSEDEFEFVDGLPGMLDIAMEAFDVRDFSSQINFDEAPGLNNESFADGRPDNRGLRMNQIYQLTGNGRQTGALNGAGTRTLHLGVDLPRVDAMRRGDRLAIGGVGLGANLHNMTHPMLERSDPNGGLQARIERINRSSMSGLVRAPSDDIFELGQTLANQLAAALSNGRRPAYTHHLIPGASSLPGGTPSKFTEAPAVSKSLDVAVEGALNDSDSQASTELARLLRLTVAATAMEIYAPMSTVERWQEEARMLMGSQASTYAEWIAHAILNRLIPEAICQGLLKRRYEVELTRREAEADRQRMEREDLERREREEAAREAEEQRLREADAAMALDSAEDIQADDSKADESGSEAGSSDGSSDGNDDDGDDEDDDDNGGDDDEEEEDDGDSGPAAEPTPVYTIINGERLDITDTGIDPEFLEALPDDLRMEVIQGRREELRIERQSASGGAGARDGQPASGSDGAQQNIDQDFLAALPPEIREEIMEEERLQRQMLAHQEMLRQRYGASATGASGAGAARGEGGAGDSALGSGRSQEVSPINAAIQERLHLGIPSNPSAPRFLNQNVFSVASAFNALTAGNSGGRAAGSGGNEEAGNGEDDEQQRLREKRRKKIASRDINTQLLSRAEMAALARFLFLPNHGTLSPMVTKTMQYISENGRTRSQLIHLMLSILDSNATTLQEVDAIIRQVIAIGSSNNPADPPPLGTVDSSSATVAPATVLLGAPSVAQFAVSLVQQQNSEFSFPLSELQTDTAAYIPAQRCLDMLHSLASHNPRAAMHFLIEHTTFKSLSTDRQQSPQQGGDEQSGGSDDEESRFPVVHLLRLLEKPLYYGHGNAITELLMQLLSTITKPLSSMVRRNEQVQRSNQQQATSESAGGSASGNTTGAVALPLPAIPPHALRAIVNVLAAGECTSRTFQHTLSLIQNLSSMTGVLTVITDELVKRASSLADDVCKDISGLLDLLKSLPAPEAQQDSKHSGLEMSRGKTLQTSTGDDDRAGTPLDIPSEVLDQVRDITLAEFSPASSHQSRLLRLLMAIDYISNTVTKRLEERQQSKGNATIAEGQQQEQEQGRQVQQEQEQQQSVEGGMEIDTSGGEAVAAEDAPSAELLHLRSLSLGHDAQFLPLWEATSCCLQYTNASPELAHVATVLLPLIESFMVVFKPVVGEKTTKSTDSSVPSALQTSNSFQSLQLITPTAPTGPGLQLSGEAYFQNFTEKHKKILNMLVRNNPGLLSGSFSLLVFNPHVLDFDNKRSYFYQRLHDDSSGAGGAGGARRPGIRPLGSTLQLNVHRDTVFEDSFHQFVGKSGEEIKRGRINVRFYEEEGVDAGGVSREWFQALARQMFNPDYALFKPSASGRVTYQPNPQSWANPEHLLYFKFVGRIIGKAIVDQRVLDAYFTRSFYKHILGRKVDYRDMEAIDPSYYKSLEWILENDITDVFDETFSIEVDDFGQHRVIDLVPNGHEIEVNEDNKAEYVRLVTEQRLYRAIKDQIKAFLTGFHDVIPKDLIQIFNEQELELLISGMPDIDVDDWRNNTEYHGGYSSSSAPVQWFWRAVRSFDQEERAKLLQFVTGTSKVPLEGFAHLQGNQGVQKFQIHKDFGSPTRLPTAHTCFNQLDLPLYDNFDTLKANLLLAISECSTGFGFV